MLYVFETLAFKKVSRIYTSRKGSKKESICAIDNESEKTERENTQQQQASEHPFVAARGN